nr:hypothetical protein [Marasmiellus scandens]
MIDISPLLGLFGELCSMMFDLLLFSCVLLSFVSGKFTSLGILSFIVNSILIFLIECKVFGSKIYSLLIEISKTKYNAFLFFINYFVFVYILILVLKYNINIIYLDEVSVNVTVNGVDANISGDILRLIKETFGDVVVFTTGSRLAYLIVSKNSGLGIGPKIGITLFSGAGGVLSYRIVDRVSSRNSVSNPVILNGELRVENIHFQATGNYEIEKHPVLSYLFGMNKSCSINNVDKTFTVSKNIDGISTLKEVSSSNSKGVIESLSENNPDWASKFHNFKLNSPYEDETGIISLIIDNLSDHLSLTIISIYLLLMLLLIFICKLVLSNDLYLKRISNLKLFKGYVGSKISKFLIWYISIWQKSSSVWIFFIIIMLLMFNVVSLYSIIAM